MLILHLGGLKSGRLPRSQRFRQIRLLIHHITTVMRRTGFQVQVIEFLRSYRSMLARDLAMLVTNAF